MYDAIIVGARVAGASTAMLMARRGLKVLVVDRAQFPSDTLSSHQVQVPGVARLRRWGLLDAVIAAGTPPTPRVRFDARRPDDRRVADQRRTGDDLRRGAGLAVVELWLDSPPDDPLHCPPAVTQVHTHDGGVSRRIVSHYASVSPSNSANAAP